MKLPLLVATSALVASSVLSSPAQAALNDYRCRSSAARPYPVVLAHGRSGSAAGMVDIIGALGAAGYCVFGEDYGRINGQGQTGMAHLNQSGGELAAVVQKVLDATGAQKVNVVGYSEGTAVIDNFILAKGGAAKVNRMVSFAGGHHPYAHAGLAGVIDGILFCPNTIQAVRDSLPPFTSNISSDDIIAAALGLASVVGQKLSPSDEEIVRSQFAKDLFDGNYWTSLHGSLSEPKGTFVVVGNTVHSLPTKDAAPNVCYTNMISPADTLVGASAGFQDPASNVVNQVLPSTTDHGTIITDKVGLASMVVAFETPCVPAPDGGPAQGGDGGVYERPEVDAGVVGHDAGSTEPGSAEEDAPEDGVSPGRRGIIPPSSGCGCEVVPSSSTTGGVAALGLLGFAFARRRKTAR